MITRATKNNQSHRRYITRATKNAGKNLEKMKGKQARRRKGNHKTIPLQKAAQRANHERLKEAARLRSRRKRGVDNKTISALLQADQQIKRAKETVRKRAYRARRRAKENANRVGKRAKENAKRALRMTPPRKAAQRTSHERAKEAARLRKRKQRVNDKQSGKKRVDNRPVSALSQAEQEVKRENDTVRMRAHRARKRAKENAKRAGMKVSREARIGGGRRTEIRQ
ncbi:hypothetical protein M378DRAFT_165706 [Amanita muscaria Koide BX008]|uniref:Uncharacterized protein n=1 Tax=Amanita muscaria (strain Koide BX008) TaxID=946122 RepID=A0A0C2T7F2_AMAMK|nr:hypothetical protein M378DRAFT_165706 [Amanita muscaria Koide BX008]